MWAGVRHETHGSSPPMPNDAVEPATDASIAERASSTRRGSPDVPEEATTTATPSVTGSPGVKTVSSPVALEEGGRLRSIDQPPALVLTQPNVQRQERHAVGPTSVHDLDPRRTGSEFDREQLARRKTERRAAWARAYRGRRWCSALDDEVDAGDVEVDVAHQAGRRCTGPAASGQCFTVLPRKVALPTSVASRV